MPRCCGASSRLRGSASKKTVHTPPNSSGLTLLWLARNGGSNSKKHRLIFIDETGAATNMVRRYGRSPRGERVIGYAPNGHWKTTTFVAGLTSQGLILRSLSM